MKILKDAAAPQSVPHAAPKWSFWKAAAAMQQRTLWWVTFKNIVMGWRVKLCGKNLYDEQSRLGKTGPGLDQDRRENTYHQACLKKGGKRSGWTDELRVLATRFFRLSCCLLGSSWIPLTPFDALLWIRGFHGFEFREFIPATACV